MCLAGLRLTALTSLVVLVAACGGPASPPCRDASTAAPSAPARPQNTAAAEVSPLVRIALAPDPAAMRLGVALDFGAEVDLGDGLDLEATATPEELTASDATGPLAVDVAGARVRFGRPVRAPLHLGYRLAAVAPPPPRERATAPRAEIDGENLRVLGSAALALPKAIDRRVVSVALSIAPHGEGRAASSFGVGSDRRFLATGAMLRDALYLAGPLGEAHFDTAECHDEAAWTGYTAFDPRPIAADVAAFRTAARDALHDKSADPFTLLIVSDARPLGRFVASRRASSVVVHLALTEPWGGALRIAVATEVLKRWIGGEAWVGPVDARQAEGFWFSEGVSRGLARAMLFRFGVVTPAEMLDEMHGLEGTVRTSALRGLSNADLASRSREPGALPLLVARGALYAARVDALLRKGSKGKRSLDDVVRALIERARATKGPLPTSAWLDAVRVDLGDTEAAAFAAAIEKGEPPRMPNDALGPCFSTTPRTYAAYDLGFDLEASRSDARPDGTREPRLIAGLRADGPAARGGLLPTDKLIEAAPLAPRADVAVAVTVERAGAPRKVTYLPAGTSARGEGWTRKRDVPDEACAR